MLGAAVWHLPRGDVQNVVSNLVLVAVLALIAGVRWRTHRLPAR